jgi:hypothetical protein
MGPLDDRSSKIGKVVTNLQALEFSLRLFLDETQGYPNAKREITINLTGLTVGEWVPENYFTNYDTLNQLIRKVNAELQSRGLSEQIDESIVELRDALAHGRVLANHPDGPFRILKFSKPMNGKTRVTVSVEMTSDWLSQQVKRTANEVLKIVKIGQSIGLKCFPSE